MSYISCGFTPEEVLQAGLDARPASDWHSPICSDGKFRWHASALSACPRQQILKRAGLATDKSPLEGELTMQLGSFFHEKAEQWVKDWCQVNGKKATILSQEKGYWHHSLPLAAKEDLLLELTVGSEPYLIDFKTEHELGSKRRSEEAKEFGRATNAKMDHQIQLMATAMCLEKTFGPIRAGAIWYISKNNFWIESSPVDLEDPLLRQDVEHRIDVLEKAWKACETTNVLEGLLLPDRMPENYWGCRPIKPLPKGVKCFDVPGPGRYCRARTACMERP